MTTNALGVPDVILYHGRYQAPSSAPTDASSSSSYTATAHETAVNCLLWVNQAYRWKKVRPTNQRASFKNAVTSGSKICNQQAAFLVHFTYTSMALFSYKNLIKVHEINGEW